jgi:hypothetical protein
MAILAGSGANADVAEESVMHSIVEAEIMKARTRPRRTAGCTGLVWREPPDRAARRCGCCACRGCCLVFGLSRFAPAILCGVNGPWPAWHWLTLPGGSEDEALPGRAGEPGRRRHL